MSTPSKKAPGQQTLAQTLADNRHQIRTQLLQLDTQALARKSGFLKRRPRKISMTDFLLALVALSAETVLSLERIAAVIRLVAQVSYTKQALQKRLTAHIELFLAQVATTLFGQFSQAVGTQGWFGPFRRVLLHDSTVQALPSRLARLFPGSGNQRRYASASLRIQFVTDLRSASLVQCSLSAFTHNDQAAAPEILSVVQAGDLVLRDLGCFACAVLAALDLRGAYFLSRYKHGVGVRDLSGQPLDLEKELRTRGRIDRQVLLGSEQTPVRLVAH